MSLSGNIQGIALMLVSSVCAAGMHAAIKYIAFRIHPFEIFFLRQSIALFLLIPIFINIGFAALRTDRLTGHILRGACMTVGGMAWFWAISLVPLAKVTALNLSAVLFTILGAIIFLKEVSELKRWAALIFGFAGVVAIVRPGYEIISFGIILVLATRLFPAVARLLSKVLSKTEKHQLLSSIPAAVVWVTPNLYQFGLILIISICGTCSQLSMVHAYKLGDMGAVEPFHFVRLIWAALFGFILFGEIPSLWVWIGAAMIIIAVSYLAHGEAKKRDPLVEQPGATSN